MQVLLQSKGFFREFTAIAIPFTETLSGKSQNRPICYTTSPRKPRFFEIQEKILRIFTKQNLIIPLI